MLGDAWSLLVVRDLMFKGRRTFNELLDAEEGIASNILADRLQRLEAAGVLVKDRDPDDGRRSVYRRLTWVTCSPLRQMEAQPCVRTPSPIVGRLRAGRR